MVAVLAVFITCMAIVSLLSSCGTQYVPVENNHYEHHWHTDSVKQIDSVFKEKQTTIRELDSVAMAEYGIRLRNAERAFLIQTQEFERQIQKLMQQKSDTVIKVDSVQVPVPVERKLNRWEQFKMDYGAFALGGSVLAVVIIIIWLIVWIRRKFLVV